MTPVTEANYTPQKKIAHSLEMFQVICSNLFLLICYGFVAIGLWYKKPQCNEITVVLDEDSS